MFINVSWPRDVKGYYCAFCIQRNHTQNNYTHKKNILPTTASRVMPITHTNINTYFFYCVTKYLQLATLTKFYKNITRNSC